MNRDSGTRGDLVFAVQHVLALAALVGSFALETSSPPGMVVSRTLRPRSLMMTLRRRWRAAVSGCFGMRVRHAGLSRRG